MADKSIKTRIQMKRDSSENWGRATGFKPLEGEQIFYTDLNKVKVGKYKDGTTEEQKKSANHTDYLMLLSELAFLGADNTEHAETAGDADTLDGKHAAEFALKSDIPEVPTSYAPIDAEKNVQSDWNETNTSSDAFIKNKPTIPTDTNQTVKTGSVTFGANDVVEFVAGSNVSISGDATNKKITISSTDTENTLTITDKANADTADLVYAVTNLVEGGTKGHALTPTYTGLPTKAYVDKVITNGVDYLGTVSALTGLSTSAGAGDFYRVSTAFTFGTETAHIGDILIATKANPGQNTTDWDLLHTEVDSVYTHPNSGVTAGTYSKVTVNAQGHVTGGSNPTTLSGYGITDAYTKTEIDTALAGKAASAHGTHVTYSTTAPVMAGAASVGSATTVARSDHKHPTDTSRAAAADLASLKTKVDTLISHGTADPSASTASQYYFKY